MSEDKRQLAIEIHERVFQGKTPEQQIAAIEKLLEMIKNPLQISLIRMAIGMQAK